ncbi:MAG: Protease Do [Candidatus Moranbacteria bacterium GW2011_GWE1_49_15]|nr:MAG: Protease Do [Candidatus Moranbacteria bacterium GW2011_GWE2_47_10]KKW06583.1 MAG: Protease Do [Candidatus Moranbacteria bacterium GW2011_GWE1_49_15]
MIFGIILFSSFFGAVFGFMAGGISGVFDGGLLQSKLRSIGISERIINTETIVVEDSEVISVVKRSSPAVVSIAVTKEIPNLRNFDFFGFEIPDEGDTQRQEIGGGSGFFVSQDGMIATNRHVVEDTDAEYTVITNDGTEFPASVLARDPVHDIAIIKIDGTDFPILPIGDSDSIQIGQTVIAIGNSLGEFLNTVSRGIVSGLGRTVIAGTDFGSAPERLTDIIQTDAAINPGNSGGPLINIQGEVVGMNVAMARGAQNIGFALPVNQIKKVINQVKETGRISVPFLGVRYIPLSAELQENNDLPFDYGVLVQRGSTLSELAVIPGSPADKAGIMENDIILEIDGKRISEQNQLGDLISEHNVGDAVKLKIWQKGVEKEIQVILEERS